MITIYTDGSCLGNPGPGGWAAIIVDEQGNKRAIGGHEDTTTNNRMEMSAAIRGLEAVPDRTPVTVYSDSQYLVNTMVKGWRRTANQDLWEMLDAEVKKRKVSWQWVRGHNGHRENEEANALAMDYSKRSVTMGLSHLDAQGRARMVGVGEKDATLRIAVAKGSVFMQPETLRMIQQGKMDKGDVLTVARIAGIMGAKRTPDLIPMCHPIPIDRIAVELLADEAKRAIHITATVETVAKTGVEMEAMTAVTIAALAVYDMAKSADKAMRIGDVRLVRKRGGKSGDILLEP
ncbi:MAG: cyclic pyranopterin monophosphate synthase MoaC [Chloroflexi bacterium]|nr:cyclic pyranopterin monophosphate synthase MoaC [Chloroflexota bacterium]